MIIALLIAYALVCIIGLAASIYSTIAVNPAFALCTGVCAYGLSTAIIAIRVTRQEQATR